MLKFGTKNTLLEYLWARILKNYCHIANQYPRICLTGTFPKKQKCLNLVPNMSYLGIFELEFENNIVIFEISNLRFV